jgi:hypothetical protein
MVANEFMLGALMAAVPLTSPRLHPRWCATRGWLLGCSAAEVTLGLKALN